MRSPRTCRRPEHQLTLGGAEVFAVAPVTPRRLGAVRCCRFVIHVPKRCCLLALTALLAIGCRTAAPRPPGEEALLFTDAMTEPRRLEGRDPQFTPEAMLRGSRGQMALRCVITTHGRLERCEVLRSVPGMEAEVLSAVSTWLFEPATLDGRPVAVRYVLMFRFETPDDSADPDLPPSETTEPQL
jgi:TonB family protein